MSSSSPRVFCHGHCPALPVAHVPRSRLLDLLRKPRRLRLLRAPAGYGKSTLLSECLQSLPAGQARVWIGFGGQALSMERFCVHLARSLGCESLDRTSLRRLLEERREPLWLVLDDYPQHACAEMDEWVDDLLAQPDLPLQLLVSSRQRPAWNLPRLLLEDQLLELDARELAFTRDEFDALASRLDGHPAPRAAERIWRDTHGWCAGACLSLLALRDGSDATAWLRGFLQRELLGRLDAAEQAALASIAHLPKVSETLCDQLWEGQGGGAMFRSLLQKQSLLQPVPAREGWYQLLPAFVPALRELADKATLGRLQLHACRILGRLGEVDDAIDMALGAGQPEVAVSFMDRLGLDWLLTEDHMKQLLDWRRNLPAELMESTPRLIFQNTRALLFSWRLDEAQVCLDRLGNYLPQPSAARNIRLLANWQALHGAVQGLRGNAAAAREHCQAALGWLADSDGRAALLCHFTLGRVAMASGQPDEARRLMQAALELARREECLASEVLVNCDLIRLELLAGEHQRAAVLLDESLHLVERSGRQHDLLLCRLLLLRGEIHLLRGALPAGEEVLLDAVRHARSAADPFILHGCLCLAEIAAMRGEHDRARSLLDEAERHMHCARILPFCYEGILQLFGMRLLARQGDWQRALRMARDIEVDATRLPPLHVPSLRQRSQFLHALAELGSGQHAQGWARLEALRQACERLQFRNVASLVQRAFGWLDSECRSSGGTAAECQAAPNAGLQRALQNWLTPAPAECSRAEPAVMPEKEPDSLLTRREVSVLKLLADGLSNEEVGASLYISLNTVKTHTKKINSKLGVNRRTQAIMRAKAMGILA
ncbi:HTH-type transcriptional regulator MalT [compost metagenome]